MLFFCKNITFNRTVIQGMNSAVCGQYCVLYIIFRSRFISYKDFVSCFRGFSSEVADHVVNFFISNISNRTFQTHSKDIDVLDMQKCLLPSYKNKN